MKLHSLMYCVKKVYKDNSSFLFCRIWLLPGYIQAEKCLKLVLCGESDNVYKSLFYVGKMIMFIAEETLCSVCRCNNVLYIRGVEEEEEDGEMRE